MSPDLPRRAFLGGAVAAGAMAALPTVAAEAATDPVPVPLPALRVPQTDLGLEQQPNGTVNWLQDAKIGMFIHWGAYAGPAQGEWYMRNQQVKPSVYRELVTDATAQQFTADQYDPSAWAQLAKDAGARYVVLTTRHHDGFGLAANSHPNAWTSTQAPLRRDFVKDYVAAVRAAGLKVGLYYSPINWRYPGYYNVNGDKLASPPWNYEGSDPASFDYVANARTMKEEVYQAVKQLVTDYGAIDELWWDGGWLAEKGSDADGAYFWESGLLRDASNRWNVDAYGETDASGRRLGLMGMVRKHQPGIVVTSRSGWMGDYQSLEGPGAGITGPVMAGAVERAFTIAGAWGYTGDNSMSYDQALPVVVNSVVRNQSVLINVGPDRHGVVAPKQAEVMRRLGVFLAWAGESVYGTRGGPWNPVDGQVGYTYRADTFYAHLLAGQAAGAFTTPSVGDAKVRRVYDVRTKQALPYTVGSDSRVTVTGIDRTAHNLDTVLAVVLDRPLVAADIARAKPTTVDSEETARGNLAGNATDGDTATRWCAADGNTGHWLRVDLGAQTALTGARVAWEFPNRTYRYRIQGSTDGTTWSTLMDRTGNTDTSQVHTLRFTSTARYVRLTVTGLDSGTWASVRQFEVFDRPFS
ncbi:hypothetical protein GCM10029964_063450 [Kibdelosporangium lantanae]